MLSFLGFLMRTSESVYLNLIVYMLLGDKFKVRNQCYVSDTYLQQEILTNVTWCLLVTVVDTPPVILEVSH